MSKIEAILIKPLDGQPEGATLSFDETDFKRLVDMGAVKAKPEPKKLAAKKPE